MVALVKLIATKSDTMGYTTYVFECLDVEIRRQTKYLMMVRYPNWNEDTLFLGDIGYVHYEEIQAGIDKWWDGTKMVPYNYNAIQFIKFVLKEEKEDHKYIM